MTQIHPNSFKWVNRRSHREKALSRQLLQFTLKLSRREQSGRGHFPSFSLLESGYRSIRNDQVGTGCAPGEAHCVVLLTLHLLPTVCNGPDRSRVSPFVQFNIFYDPHSCNILSLVSTVIIILFHKPQDPRNNIPIKA